MFQSFKSSISPLFHAAKLLLFFYICKFLCDFFAFFVILGTTPIFYFHALKSQIYGVYSYFVMIELSHMTRTRERG